MRGDSPSSSGVAVAILLLVSPPEAWGQPAGQPRGETSVREVSLQTEGGSVLVSFSVDELVDESVSRRLTSGFTVRVVQRAWLIAGEGGEAGNVVAGTARTVEVRYDLWDEEFTVVAHSPGGRVSRRQVRSVDEVRGLLAQVSNLAAFDTSLVPADKPCHVAVVVEVDPLSDEQLSEVRSWLSRPQSGHRELALGGRSFFGSFVSLFVNVKVGHAARTVRFRSQDFAAGQIPVAGGP